MGAIPVIAEAAPWSLRSLRAASAVTGTLSAKADRLNVLKADTSICCQHRKLPITIEKRKEGDALH